MHAEQPRVWAHALAVGRRGGVPSGRKAPQATKASHLAHPAPSCPGSVRGEDTAPRGRGPWTDSLRTGRLGFTTPAACVVSLPGRTFPNVLRIKPAPRLSPDRPLRFPATAPNSPGSSFGERGGRRGGAGAPAGAVAPWRTPPPVAATDGVTGRGRGRDLAGCRTFRGLPQRLADSDAVRGHVSGAKGADRGAVSRLQRTQRRALPASALGAGWLYETLVKTLCSQPCVRGRVAATSVVSASESSPPRARAVTARAVHSEDAVVQTGAPSEHRRPRVTPDRTGGGGVGTGLPAPRLPEFLEMQVKAIFATGPPPPPPRAFLEGTHLGSRCRQAGEAVQPRSPRRGRGHPCSSCSPRGRALRGVRGWEAGSVTRYPIQLCRVAPTTCWDSPTMSLVKTLET